VKFLIEILGFFSAKLCFTALYYFCINLIIIITSDVLTAKCFDFCKSSSGYLKRKVFFFGLTVYYFYCFIIVLVTLLSFVLGEILGTAWSYLPGYCTYVPEWHCWVMLCGCVIISAYFQVRLRNVPSLHHLNDPKQ